MELICQINCKDISLIDFLHHMEEGNTKD
jgi:hypothetical protein